MPELGVGPAPEPGRPDELAPGLWRLTAPNPGMMTGPGTNSYLLGAGELAVVDPGPDHDGHLERLVEVVEDRGEVVRWILVTHTHPDHAPGAAGLAARTGAQVVGFGTRDGFVPDRSVGDGWALRGPGFTLRAVHTPGHASNHLCWLYEEQGILLSGDHVMHGSTVVIRPPDGDVAVYLASLRLIGQLSPAVVAIAPGHGRLIGDPAGVVGAIIEHRLERERRVAGALAAAGPSRVADLLAAIYADVDEKLLPMARFSLWAHLRTLADEGRARCSVPISDRGADLHGRWEMVAR